MKEIIYIRELLNMTQLEFANIVLWYNTRNALAQIEKWYTKAIKNKNRLFKTIKLYLLELWIPQNMLKDYENNWLLTRETELMILIAINNKKIKTIQDENEIFETELNKIIYD